MDQEQCVNCGSENVKKIGNCEDIRPNGDNMEQFECNECSQIWKE